MGGPPRRLQDEQFRASVRSKRQLQQAQQIVRLQNNGFESTINGRKVVLVVVNGNFRL